MRAILLRSATALLVVVGVACAADDSSSSSDAAGSGDGRSTEAGSRDGRLGDGVGPGDGAKADGWNGDGAAPGDGAPADTKPGPTVTGGACTNPVTPPVPPCSPASSKPLQTYCNTADPSQVIMATCMGSDSQCTAEDACATGWHLCTGTEYLARGGKTIPQNSTIIRAWIAACGRDLDGTKLKDGVCSSCETGEIGAPWGMLYECTTGNQIGPGMADGTLAVVTSDICMRLIQNTPANGGYWSLYWAGLGAGGSVCCLDNP